jgi:molecular chaperone GrpE
VTDQRPGASGGVGGVDPTRPVIRDRRRLDPATGQVREQFAHPHDAAASSRTGAASPGASGGADVGPTDGALDVGPTDGALDVGPTDGALDVGPTDGALDAAEAKAAEYLADLQRLQAEYVNYRKRVDRDRFVARELAIAEVIEALTPTLDEIDLARRHGELEGGPFAAIAEKLEAALQRFGWERYGAVGEGFDPTVHEALMHGHSDDVTESTVTQVLQPGHRVGDRILRAARVAVTDPE